MQDLISVIVPAYNVGTYIDKCITSILNQDYPNFELILMDDGSKDDTASICDRYAQKDERVRVFHRENQGLADTRNDGIRFAKGTYIYFVDGDDFLIRKDTLSLLEMVLREKNADISIAGYQEFKSEDQVQREKPSDKLGIEVISGKEAVHRIDEWKGYQHTFVIAHNKLYKKSLFEDIAYPSKRLHEDEATTYLLYLKSNKVAYLSVATYGYRIREASIMRSRYSLNRLDGLKALEEKLTVFHQYEMDDNELRYHYLMLLCYHRYYLRKMGYYKEYEEIQDKFRNSKRPKLSLKRRFKLLLLTYGNDLFFPYVNS